MRTEREIRDWLADLETYKPGSPEQGIGLAASISTLWWTLGEKRMDGVGPGPDWTKDDHGVITVHHPGFYELDGEGGLRRVEGPR